MHNCQYCISHKSVENIKEIPKLKFTADRNIKRSRQVNKQEGIAVEVHFLCCILQEFQYGKDVFQTTTNTQNRPLRM